MLTHQFIFPYFKAKYRFSVSWFEALYFYKRITSYRSKFLLKFQIDLNPWRKKKNLNLYRGERGRRKYFFINYYHRIKNPKTIFMVNISYYTKDIPKKFKTTLSVGRLGGIRVNNYRVSKLSFLTANYTKKLLKSDNVSIYDEFFSNWKRVSPDSTYRKGLIKYQTARKKLGLYNLFFGWGSVDNRNTRFRLRKKLHTLPERNGPTWWIIRKLFRPKARLRIKKTYNMPYYIKDVVLPKSNYRRRRFRLAKMFFHASIYMFIKRRRVAVDKYFNLRFNYQKRMTNFLFRFKRISSGGLMRVKYSCVDSYLRKSGLLVNPYNMVPFISNRWVFLNGHSISYSLFPVFQGDAISVFVSWQVLMYLYKSFKYIKKNRYNLNRYYFLFLVKRRKRKTVKYWVKKYEEFRPKPSNVLERDFLSMTAVIIRDYNYKDPLLRPVHTSIPYGALYNFNWKFIT